ncbi:hypothetical protein C0Q70_12893 [Pomacea canaliculata]|uniref:NodB homology domain-containing protein n=1 Tax=Pomacea canaliculata TaxID=400727 RepID=A0A2T7P2R6_POMCA|nr:uncharacterized protein LOC112569469 [Pomacea canaliculata]PVD27722.1 hypothetical protein C0Q70_12893 [Pomacea canaliculata]
MLFARLSLPVIVLATVVSLTSAQEQCTPGGNCQLPNCRCWSDFSSPGGFDIDDVPQAILLTFEYAINDANFNYYLKLFEGFTNPNNCPAAGTFFPQVNFTDFGDVKQLYDLGHEIGVTSVDGTVPATREDWIIGLAAVRDQIEISGVSRWDVVGVRAPNLRPGGTDEFTALATDGFEYDASCTSSAYGLMWPYTYDFPTGTPRCDNGATPDQAFPAKWQYIVSDLEFRGSKCATPSGCPGVATQEDVLELFSGSFLQHYEDRKTPFMVVISPDWLAVPYRLDGTREFLQFVRDNFEDTWILSVSQSLEWVKYPVPNSETDSFEPWSC